MLKVKLQLQHFVECVLFHLVTFVKNAVAIICGIRCSILTDYIFMLGNNPTFLFQELRKGQTVRSQLDVYKRQVQELQMKSIDETKRADKAEFETKRLQEKMASLQREKEVGLSCTTVQLNWDCALTDLTH